MNMTKALIPAGLAVCSTIVLLLTGCAGQTPTERDFGRSVRLVTTNQVHDKDTLVYTADDAVTGGHPDRLENVVEAHTAEVAESQRVERPLTISVSGGAGQ